MNEDRYTIFNGNCFNIMERLIAEGTKVDAIICDHHIILI